MYLYVQLCFRNHEHCALNIFNSVSVVVKNCTFHNNTCDSYFTRKPFQGSGGALSIGYNAKLASLNSANVLVTGCVFSSNKAVAALRLSTTDIFSRNIFSGRGGGLSMPINAIWPLNIIVNNSMFINNFALNHGGSFYCHISENVSNQSYLFESNIFIKSRALLGSGAINIGNYGYSIPFSTLHITIYNCTFDNNAAQIGGCFRITPSNRGFSGNFLNVINCSFNNNTSTLRGIVDLASFNYYKTRQHYEPVHFSNW